MPELPEVERAAALLRSLANGKIIAEIETVEDTIVYSGTTHTEFADEIRGRKVSDVRRYGKVFYMVLEGPGRMPVLHFGMTGMLQVKGQLATYYKETPRTASADWPPRFMKFILHIRDPLSDTTTEVAFLDARRLGRIRLAKSPLDEPPISSLGFDPIFSMPTLDDFKPKVSKRSCPTKALLLDQSFSAGVGNWVADEILYHARIHPERRCNTLNDDELAALHMQIRHVCKVAVDVDADDSKFPENWLFKHRWGKGKKKHDLLLPSGEPATIKWITVGGRTSAYVEELQHLGTFTKPQSKAKKRAVSRGKKVEASDVEGSESDLTPLEDDDDPVSVKAGRKRKAGNTTHSGKQPRRRLQSTSKLEEPANVAVPPAGVRRSSRTKNS